MQLGQRFNRDVAPCVADMVLLVTRRPNPTLASHPRTHDTAGDHPHVSRTCRASQVIAA
jgi:hypothetical protein